MILPKGHVPKDGPILWRRTVLAGLLAVPLRGLVSAFAVAFFRSGQSRASTGLPDAATCEVPEGMSRRWGAMRRNRVMAALSKGFGVQYWGETFTAGHLSAAPHGLLIIETAKTGANAEDHSREVFFSPQEVRRISHEGRRPVLGYLNLAKIEPYRDYWVESLAVSGNPKSLGPRDARWIGPSLGKEGTLARYWTPGWETILKDRVDQLLRQGVDGLFLDDVLQYYTYFQGVAAQRAEFSTPDGPRSAGEFARAMMHLVLSISNHARGQGCGTLIIVNNGVFIGRDAGEEPDASPSPNTFSRYRAALDGILIESVFAAGGDLHAISALQEDFASEGVPILTIDFGDADGRSADALRADIRHQAQRLGFTPYVADDAAFNRLYPPIPVGPAASDDP